MRRIRRSDLNKRTISYLDRWRDRVRNGHPIDAAWDSARKTKTMNNVYLELCKMGGKRERCFFCEDSRGTDIEHFWPKSDYPNKAFTWTNLLLACSGCNRSKGKSFPLDANDNPLLIDPTIENPWDFLFFDNQTGNIVAKWDVDNECPHPKGEITAESGILPINQESIVEGRLRIFRNIKRAINAFLESCLNGQNIEDESETLLELINDNDCYGLPYWFFIGEGQNDLPFSQLRDNYHGVWDTICDAIQ